MRRWLEPERRNGCSEYLTLESGSYVLRLNADELDSLRFEELAASGRDASRRGDVRQANEDLSAALRCWRGAAFADIRGLSAARGPIARLEQLRAATLEELVDVRLALDMPTTVIDMLLEALEEFPLHERLVGQLMLALYRCGRQSEALRAFADLAARLDEQLGLKPCAELRQIEEDILLQQRHLDLPSRPSPSISGAHARPERVRLIGRRAELGRLVDLHDCVRSGTRGFALVSGAAGIGKTALVAEYCERARRAGAAILVGRCAPPPEQGYGPIVQALTSAPPSSGSTREEVVDVLNLLRGEETHARSDSDASDSTDSSSEVLHLMEAIADVIGSIATTPVVLVVEDVQFVDRATLRVLRHLMRHSQLDHLFVVATLCDDDLDAETAERITRLAPPVQMHRLDLIGLDVYEVRALIRAATSSPATPVLLDVAPAISDATGGNPLHVRALLREIDDLVAAGADRDQIVAAIATLAPAGLRALVDGRVDRLTAIAKSVLEAAATIGGTITTALLVEICDLSASAVGEAIEEVLDSRFLDEHEWHVDQYEFPHAAIRNAVYQGVSERERMTLHLRVAEVLEACDTGHRPRRSAEVAHHYAAALPLADPGKAADRARSAGDDASKSLSFAEAASWYERALRFAAEADWSSRSTAELELALGQAYEADHQFAKAQAGFVSGAMHARESRDTALLADLAVAANGPWTSGLGDQDAKREILEDALDRIGDCDAVRRINLLTALGSSLYYVDAEREGRVVAEALELARSLDDPARSAKAHLAEHLWLTHEPEARLDRVRVAETALQLAAQRPAPRHELRARRELLTDLLENGDVNDFELGLDAYARLANEQCSPRDIYWSMALRATLATLRGDLVAAEQLARGARLRGRELQQESAGAELLQRFVIRFQQGRLAEEVGLLRQEGTGSSVYRAGSCLAALACAETGRAAEGVRIARWAIGRDGGGVPRDAFWLGAHVLFASVAATAKDTELAEQLAALIAPCADHVVVFGAGGAVLGSGHHWLGLLELTCDRWDRAVEHLEEADRVSAQIDAPYWAAQAQLDLARALCRRGKGNDARVASSLTKSAVSSARRYGYGRLLTGAATMLDH